MGELLASKQQPTRAHSDSDVTLPHCSREETLMSQRSEHGRGFRLNTIPCNWICRHRIALNRRRWSCPLHTRWSSRRTCHPHHNCAPPRYPGRTRRTRNTSPTPDTSRPPPQHNCARTRPPPPTPSLQEASSLTTDLKRIVYGICTCTGTFKINLCTTVSSRSPGQANAVVRRAVNNASRITTGSIGASYKHCKHLECDQIWVSTLN